MSAGAGTRVPGLGYGWTLVYKKVLYSVPFTLAGKQLCLKVTDTANGSDRHLIAASRRHPAVVSHSFAAS